MSASDSFRETATFEFMNLGLGAKLTDNSRALMRGLDEGIFPDAGRWAISFACGNIIERVLWQAFGIWIGYFNAAPPVTELEKTFLAKYAGLLKELEMPLQFLDVSDQLAHRDSATKSVFFQETSQFFPRQVDVPEWFPVFQATLITSELLNDPAITSFFLFLLQGNVEQFQEQTPDPNAVYSFLRDGEFTIPFRTAQQQPEAVIAGLIRYTEFLSAMDGIFPDTSARSFAEAEEGIPNRIIDRDILCRVTLEPRSWRFPKRSVDCFHASLQSFGQLTASEFAKYPEMRIQWASAETFSSIWRLSQKFFMELNGAEIQGDVDPQVIRDRDRRSSAIERRVQALRGE